MRILFERSGGIMGSKSSLSIKLDELPLDQAETLRRLVSDADFFSLSENPATRPSPDAFQYTITVETDTIQHTVRASDTTASDELRALIQELSQRARSKRGSKQ